MLLWLTPAMEDESLFIETGETIARGVARNARIDNGNGVPALAQRRLEPDWKRIVDGKARAGSETVSKDDDLLRFVCRLHKTRN